MPLTNLTGLPHEMTIVVGSAAVNSYFRGISKRSRLEQIGDVQTYKFASLREANAFALGVDLASGHSAAIAVDDIP